MELMKIIDEYLELCRTAEQADYWVERKAQRLAAISAELPKDVGEIRAIHIARFIQKRKRAGSAAVSKDVSILRSVLSYARESGFISRNPMVQVKLPKTDRPPVVVYTLAEIDKLIGAATGDIKAYLLALKYTAGRPGEVRKIKWQDIDFEKGTILLGRAASRTKPQREQVLVDPLRKVFESIGRNGSDYVFDFKDRRRNLKAVARKARVPWKGLKSIRSGIATHLLNQMGSNPKNVADILGHSSLAHVMRYCKESKEINRNLLEKL